MVIKSCEAFDYYDLVAFYFGILRYGLASRKGKEYHAAVKETDIVKVN